MEQKSGAPDRRIDKVISLFPLLLLIIAVLGFVYSYSRGGLESAVNSLVYVAPILFAAGFLFFVRFNDHTFNIQNYTLKISLNHLVLLYILIFISSLILLLHFPTRPVAYFVVVALLSGIIFLQIFVIRPRWTDYLIIFEIVCLSLNLIWGITLKYPLFFGATDTLGHLYDINTIIKSSHINNIDPTYLHFPLFSILNAEASEISQLSSPTSLFIFMAVTWEVGIIFAFLIFKRLEINNSSKFSLVACLLLAMSSQLLFYGVYMISRSLAYVLFLCWIYTLFDIQTGNKNYVILSLFIMCAMILSHHVSMGFFIPLALIVYICQWYFLRDKQREFGLPLLPIITLTVSFFTYMCIVGHEFWIRFGSEWAGSVLGPKPETAAVVVSGAVQSVSLIRLFFYSFVLFFAFIGIGTLLKYHKFGNRYQNLAGIALATIIFLPLYISGLIELIPSLQMALVGRMALIVSPFVILVMVYGIIQLINVGSVFSNHKIYGMMWAGLITLLVMVSTLFSTFSDQNAQDLTFGKYPTAFGSQYFTKAEMSCFSYITKNIDIGSAGFYADYETIRNKIIMGYSGEKNILMNGDLDSLSLHKVYNNYLILRVGELRRLGALDFAFKSGENTYRYYLDQLSLKDNIIVSSSKRDKLYSSRDVQIYFLR